MKFKTIFLTFFVFSCAQKQINQSSTNTQTRFIAEAESGAVNCAKMAIQANIFNGHTESIITLCAGATSNQPIECAVEAFNKKILNSNFEYISRLCSGAESFAPINCVEQSLKDNLKLNYLDLYATLCSGAKNNEPLVCFKQAQNEKVFGATNINLLTRLCSTKTIIKSK